MRKDNDTLEKALTDLGKKYGADAIEKVEYKTFHVVGMGNKEVSTIMAVTLPDKDHKDRFLTQFSYFSPKDRERRQPNRKEAKRNAVRRLSGHTVIKFTKKASKSIADHVRPYIVKEVKRKGILWCQGLHENNLRL